MRGVIIPKAHTTGTVFRGFPGGSNGLVHQQGASEVTRVSPSETHFSMRLHVHVTNNSERKPGPRHQYSETRRRPLEVASVEYFCPKVSSIIPHLAAHWHPSALGRVFSSHGSNLHAIHLEERLKAPESLVVGSQKTEGQNVPPESTIKATILEGFQL